MKYRSYMLNVEHAALVRQILEDVLDDMTPNLDADQKKDVQNVIRKLS